MKILHVFVVGNREPIGLLSVTDEMADAIKSSPGLHDRLRARTGTYVKPFDPIDDEESLVVACANLSMESTQF